MLHAPLCGDNALPDLGGIHTLSFQELLQIFILHQEASGERFLQVGVSGHRLD